MAASARALRMTATKILPSSREPPQPAQWILPTYAYTPMRQFGCSLQVAWPARNHCLGCDCIVQYSSQTCCAYAESCLQVPQDVRVCLYKPDIALSLFVISCATYLRQRLVLQLFNQVNRTRERLPKLHSILNQLSQLANLATSPPIR